jgi:pimeloyl-ACP methyl ester carboxylesterase
MKGAKGLRAAIAVGLCAAGIALVLSMPREAHRTFLVDAGGCRLVTDIVEPSGGGHPQGYVLLIHGIVADKQIMSYWTSGFASEGLRVFVPDLPGHGRTAGPFSFDRADQCSSNLLRELVARGLLDPERTILAGHSMGGAIALRVASREPVAGVVAISPAPMQPVPGLPPETIPYHDFGKLPAHSLVMSGSWEPANISNAGKALVNASTDGSSAYISIPHASHVGILFDAKAMSAAEAWVARVLRLKVLQPLPPLRGAIGFFLGMAGIITLTGPFLRELLQPKKRPESLAETTGGVSMGRAFVVTAIVAFGAVGLLYRWVPLRFLHVFEGDYLASLLLFTGVLTLSVQSKALRDLFRGPQVASEHTRPQYISVLLAAFGAILLCILIGAWFDLSLMEIWPTTGRLVRFLPFLAAVLPCHVAEELLLGPKRDRHVAARLAIALALRLVIWVALVAGIFRLHSGQILPVIMLPYFGLFCLGQRWAMEVVREATASPSASALFGAILLAGFSLVVFPTT